LRSNSSTREISEVAGVISAAAPGAEVIAMEQAIRAKIGFMEYE